MHPEYEIVFISPGTNGRLLIGDHSSYYSDGDLIFIGPNIPHYGFTEHFKHEHFEIVVQLHEDFLGHTFLDAPEMQGIRQLFEKSKSGLHFSGKIKKEIGQDLLQMTKMNNFDRLLRLLRILKKMEATEEYTMLNARDFTVEVNSKDSSRMHTIYSYVSNNYLDSINLEDIAGEVQMTVPSFCRYFKGLTGKTFTLFVNEFRIMHACQLLSKTSKSITEICYDSGFNNLSHFNKQFRLVAGQTAGDYRKERKVILNV